MYFVPLAHISDVSLLSPALADALGFSFMGSEDPDTQVLTYLKDKEMLLLLDNFEHLLDGAAFLAELLRVAPGLKMMVTTRERLNLSEEWLFEVEGLEVPSPQFVTNTAREQRIEDYSAVKLFMQSARRVRLDFVPSEENLAFIAQLCSLVGGMPLALELAAAWARTLSCVEIVSEVTRDLNLLVTAQRDVPERHRSIRAVFENSWKRLSEHERDVVKRISVFRGGFLLEAAKEVCGASIPLLYMLVDKSMLSVSSSGRYKMHELLRQYAEEKMNCEEQTQAYDHHCHFYLEFLQQHIQKLSSDRLKQALDEISAEMDNVRASWNWAVETRQIEAVLQSQFALCRYFELRNHFVEGEVMLGRVAELLNSTTGAGPCHPLYPQILQEQAHFLTRLARYDQAEGLLQNCLNLIDPGLPQAQRLIGQTFSGLGLIALMTGSYNQAQEYYQSALTISRELHNTNVVSTLGNLGYVYCQKGEYRQAGVLLQEMLEMVHASGFHEATAFGDYFLGLVTLGEMHVDQAASYFTDGLRIYADLKHAWGKALCLQGQALVALEKAYPAEAAQLAAEGLVNAQSIKDAHSTALCLNCLGRATSALGNSKEAQGYYLDALRTAWQAHQPPPALDSLIGIAEEYARTGQIAEARNLLELAIEHPACIARDRSRARQFLTQLPAGMPAEIHRLTFENVVTTLLRQPSPAQM